ncbi:23S rRNA pseudouridine1911/1915/1917 synthase [Sporobacter termitidis DSM 10068]|uniref:Pseudouridine synthase n=1 Tax=Sporobacter termitidis DSM 10068 TaxID=1123282 RepID=A0A1M5ZCQ6_9FIRM|nr:RluA family pseudouridine synthase [Sporobacter termitidis]SHI21991.1 23S rRNA pseudouridine1911/1915/1917 synthase [Sporobacter termitidis DSM 10068]
MRLTYSAGEKDAGRKVYIVLRRELMISDTLTRRLKRAGAIFVDGAPVFTDRRLTPGETLSVDVTAAEPPCDIVPEEGGLDILYEDAGLLAVNKPSGLITHPSRARYTGTLSNFVAGYLERTSGDGRCHAVNRLDRDTSGVVLFAKNSHMKARAGQALAGDAEKEYAALIAGVMDKPAGTIDLPIRRLREGDMLRVAAPDGQRAVTHYETTAVTEIDGDTVSSLRLRLETGRTHQIRVHCLAFGHPILGDHLYNTAFSQDISARLGLAAQALHAEKLSFTEPVSGRRLKLTAPLPDYFKSFVK